MVWQLVVIFVVLLAFAIAIGVGAFEKHRRAARIKEEERTISWQAALSRIQAGHGVVVENVTSLPGRLWWIENVEDLDQHALYDEVEKRGLCVMNPPTQKVVEQAISTEDVPSSYRRLNSEPFSD